MRLKPTTSGDLQWGSVVPDPVPVLVYLGRTRGGSARTPGGAQAVDAHAAKRPLPGGHPPSPVAAWQDSTRGNHQRVGRSCGRRHT